jgi:hypothetical protein
VPASRKLQAEDAEKIARGSKKMIVMKGRKVDEFKVGASTTPEAVTAMLGNTGNMRAPLLRVGSVVLVGFNETVYTEIFS